MDWSIAELVFGNANVAQAPFEPQLLSSSRLARHTAGTCMWLHSVGQRVSGSDGACVS